MNPYIFPSRRVSCKGLCLKKIIMKNKYNFKGNVNLLVTSDKILMIESNSTIEFILIFIVLFILNINNILPIWVTIICSIIGLIFLSIKTYVCFDFKRQVTWKVDNFLYKISKVYYHLEMAEVEIKITKDSEYQLFLIKLSHKINKETFTVIQLNDKYDLELFCNIYFKKTGIQLNVSS